MTVLYLFTVQLRLVPVFRSVPYFIPSRWYRQQHKCPLPVHKITLIRLNSHSKLLRMSKYIKHIMLSRILEEILPNQPFSHIDNHLFTVVKFYHTPEVASHIHRLLIMR